MKPLIYRKKDKTTGIYAYCQKCKTCIGTGKCRKTNKRLSTCEYPEFHTFRASVTVPNTNGRKRKKKILNTTNLIEAITLKKEFEQALKNSNYHIPKPTKNIQTIQPTIIQPHPNPLQPTTIQYLPIEEGTSAPLLINCMDQFIRYLNNEGVEEHKKKQRSQKHIDDVKRYFKYFCLVLKSNNIDHTNFTIDQVDDKIVGYIHSYLINQLNYKNKTYNKVMSAYRQFIKWLIEEKDYPLKKNPFKGVTRKKESKDDTVITHEELKKLLKAIAPENSINVSPSGYRRNYYRPWIKIAIQIALETGLRREEFTNLKFSDVQTDTNQNPYCIKVENYKVNRIKGITEESTKDIKTIPITAKMKQILKQLHFEKHIHSDRYLIAPDQQITRETVGEFLSKAFTHFWSCTGSKRKVNLKHLRKTYLTALVNYFGDKATIISDHADINILKKHYTNTDVIMKANQGFKVFG